MRIRAPRSTSPSPVRTYRTSGFRAPSCSSDEEYSSEDDSEDYDIDISVSSDSIVKLGESSGGEDSEDDSLVSSSESEADFATVRSARRKRPTTTEDEEVEETIAAIRLRARHTDPYDEWERRTRKDAFHTARKHQAEELTAFRANLRQASLAKKQVEESRWSTEIEEMQARLNSLSLDRRKEEQRMTDIWRERNRKLWERVEGAIKAEEDALRAKLEAERKAREEEERRRKAEEERRRAEEERKRTENEDRRRREEEERLKKEKADAEKREREEADRQRSEKEKGSEELRHAIGLPTANELWLTGLRTLMHLKTVTMRVVKGPKSPNPEPPGYQIPPTPPLKKLWSAQRRKITPKVGQLTDDPREIQRIIEELKAIVAPVSNIPQDQAQHLHHALLSSLAKAFIAQAETEITAHKHQAKPLARVAVALIRAYPLLADILWAKLCELIGVWAAAANPATSEGVELAPGVVEKMGDLHEKQRLKRVGARAEEGTEVQMMRVTGVLRLYFAMLVEEMQPPQPPANTGFGAFGQAQQQQQQQQQQPLPPPFRSGRYWAYLAQMLGNEQLMGNPIAPEAIYVALEEGGIPAVGIWGRQFVKLLQFVYEGVQGPEKERFGGSDALAQPSRARCALEVEKIMAAI